MNHDDHEEHDELWELLGKAREPKDSPFFASKVLRAIREEAQEPKGVSFWQWLRGSWLIPSVATGMAAVAVMFALREPSGPQPISPTQPMVALTSENTKGRLEMVINDPLNGLADAMSAMSDADEISVSLPELLATEDHSVWLQADLSSLF